MEIFDLLFWGIGRGVHKLVSRMGMSSREWSDGGYWVLGLIATCFVCFMAFIVWGVTRG